MIEQTTDCNSIYPLDPVDDVQSHMLGVIASLMINYNINPVQVQSRYEHILSLNYNHNTVEVESNDQKTVDKNQVSRSSSWADICDSDDVAASSSNNSEDTISEDTNTEDEQTPNKPIYVSTRREFCNAMGNGTKICPRYSSCTDNECLHFHIESKYICPHITRGSYCDDNDCDLIVIRPCRKGKKCNDSECSFRHR